MGALLFSLIFLSLLTLGYLIPDKYTDSIIERLGGSNDDSF